MKDNANQAFLWAMQITESQGVKDLEFHQLETTPAIGFEWLHLQAGAPDSESCLAQLGLAPEIIDALCNPETRPKALHLNDGMLIYLRGINRNPNADPEDMVSLRLWVTANRLITLRRKHRRLASVQEVKASIRHEPLPSNTIDLMLKILEKLTDKISETVDDLDEQLTLFETQDSSNPQDRIKLSQIRRQSAAIRRYLFPQRDALDAIYRYSKSLTQEQIFALREETDRTTRYVEELDLARERAMVLQDELRNQIAEQQGMRMYVLSLVTAIFLPLSFLTGVFGMNVAGLPGTEHPKAFTYLILGMGAVAGISCVAMLWKKWL